MAVQPLEYNDINLLKDFQPEGWNDILPTIHSYVKNTFCFPVKASINNSIVGIGTTIIHKDIAWLAHIIVHPGNRNQGIGKLITRALMEDSITKGCTTIYLIATDLGEPVYKKVGFEVETEYLFFKNMIADPGWLISKNIVTITDNFKTQVITLDRQISGENRSIQLEQHLATGYIYLNNNDVQGFYLPTFGEGLIIANTPLAGSELIKFRLKTNENAAFPIDNINAKTFMHQNNFKEFKTAKRMRFGIKRAWHPESIYNRIGGNLG